MVELQNITNDAVMRYYFESRRYFEYYLYEFFDAFGHIGCCRDCAGNHWEYHTAIASYVFERGMPLSGIKNPSNWIYRYFLRDDDYSDRQRFCVLFGAWLGFSKMECGLIGAKSRKNLAASILNAIICGASYQELYELIFEPCLSNYEKEVQLASWTWTGRCEIFYGDENSSLQSNHRVYAEKCGNVLIDCENTRSQYTIVGINEFLDSALPPGIYPIQIDKLPLIKAEFGF